MPERLDIIVALRNETRRGWAQIRGDLRSFTRDAERASRSVGGFGPGLRGAVSQASRLDREFDDIAASAARIEKAIDRQTIALRGQVAAAQKAARAQQQAARAQTVSLQKIDRLAGTLSGGLVGIGAGLGVAGFVELSRTLVNQGAILSDLNAQYQRSGIALAQFAGGQVAAGQAIEAVQRASGGALDKLQAQQLATQLLAVNLASSSSELERFVKVARLVPTISASVKTLDQAIGQISLAAANQSFQRLDQLGLGIDETKKRFDELKRSNSELSDQAAFLEAILGGLEGKLGGITDAAETQATGVEELRRAWKDLQLTVAEGLAPTIDESASGIAGFFDSVSLSIRALNGDFDAQKLRVQNLVTEYNSLAARQQEEFSGGGLTGFLDGSAIAVNARLIQGELNDLASTVEGLSITFDDSGQIVAVFDETMLRAKASLEAADSLAADGAQSFGDLGAAAGDSSVSVDRLTAALDAGGGSLSTYEALALSAGASIASLGAIADGVAGQIANLNAEFGAVNAAVRRGGSQTLRLGVDASEIVGLERARELIDAANANIFDRTQALKAQNLSQTELLLLTEQIVREENASLQAIVDQDKAARKLATGGAKAVNTEFSAIKSKVQGLLSGAIGPVAGIDANDLLPRQDAINEPARRLADVAVNGFNSPWVDYIRNTFPGLLDEAFSGGGDLKNVAARALRDFQDGLRPELLDKERAKERVRRMLLGEQNLAALANEISNELAAELGKSQGEVRQAVNAALGTGDTQPRQIKVQPDLTGFQEQLAQTFDVALGVGQAQSEGESAGTSFGDGMKMSLAGIGVMVSEFVQKELIADAALDVFKATGEEDGDAYVDGFEKSVETLPGKVLNSLADLIAPLIEDRLTVRQTLVGAN